MAKNGIPGDNRRHGMVKNRSQLIHPNGKNYIKRDTETGRFMDVKTSSTCKFKGVKTEKK